MFKRNRFLTVYRLICIWLSTVALSYLALAQNLATPTKVSATSSCDGNSHRKFDFWLGEWQGVWVDPRAGKQIATNTVTRINAGCGIQESFRQIGETGLIGTSISAFDPRLGKWHQTWTDNQGSVMQFEDEANSTPTFARTFTAKDGRQIMQRMRFIDIARDSFVWLWERSVDKGKSWELQWRIDYVRIKN
jgi:hypothetical protein